MLNIITTEEIKKMINITNDAIQQYFDSKPV